MTELTHEKIDKMEAGREMDLTVSKLMFGKTHLYYRCPHFDEYGRMLAFCSCPNLHSFSTDISAAWEVVEKMLDITDKNVCVQMASFNIDVQAKDCYVAWVDRDGMTKWSGADTAPLAICKAALKAVIKE